MARKTKTPAPATGAVAGTSANDPWLAVAASMARARSLAVGHKENKRGERISRDDGKATVTMPPDIAPAATIDGMAEAASPADVTVLKVSGYSPLSEDTTRSRGVALSGQDGIRDALHTLLTGDALPQAE